MIDPAEFHGVLLLMHIVPLVVLFLKGLEHGGLAVKRVNVWFTASLKHSNMSQMRRTSGLKTIMIVK